jgi:UDP-glucose 4-epimerase
LKILVVGASGYLGGKITEHLSLLGHEVYVLMRNKFNDLLWNSGISKVIIGDLRDPQVFSTLAPLRIDAVVYTVSLNHTLTENSIEAAIETNITPMWKLLNTLAKVGLPRFIYLSTQQVYGTLHPIVIEENRDPAPNNNYGLTHLMCENICHLFNKKSDTKCINLRLSNGYGSPALKNNYCWSLVINDFCKKAIEEKGIRLLSDGTPQRDFIHIRDICRAVEILLITKNEKLIDSNYNLGNGKTYTIIELAHLVRKFYIKKFGQEIPIFLVDGSISENLKSNIHTQKFQYSIKRLKKLGFCPQVTIEQGVHEIFDYLVQENLMYSK